MGLTRGGDAHVYLVKGPEGNFLKFLPHLMHSHAAGQGRINLKCLFGDTASRRVGHVLKRAHVVKTIGKFDQQDTHIRGDGEEKFSEVFRLGDFSRNQIEFANLGQALDEPSNVLAKHFVDLVTGRIRIFDRIVE